MSRQGHVKERHVKARHGREWQGQGKARQGLSMQGMSRQGMSMQGKVCQGKAPDQGLIWTFDPNPFRSYEDRELDMSKNNNHKNPEITICRIVT
jgi:hypothetical protein